MSTAIDHRRLGASLLVVLTLATSLVASVASTSLAAAKTTCVRTADGSHSVARLWDEVLLDAIRRDFPAPTVHARNLYHVSAAMWDAWAAYDPTADGVFVDDKVSLDDPAEVQAAREEAISYAAHRVLSHRYAKSAGAAESLAEFDALMTSLCYPTGRRGVRGDSPAALGNRIAATVIEAGLHDGSLEQKGYVAKGFKPANKPLIVELPGTVMKDPNAWQPLALDVSIAQNGQPLPKGPQKFVGSQWGHVTPFALPESESGLPIDPGPPPHLGDPASDADYKAAALDVIRASSVLDPSDGVTMDISPAVNGDNPLGTNDGTGHAVNPATGQPYAPEIVARADFARALAEFWADGPSSETPPGHWNTIANTVTDSPGFERRLGGQGEPLDALEWDVKMYLALNGAVHDAAIEAWGVKGYYQGVRPISMIRYMGGLGQSSDPTGPSYDPDGLPLEPGLVEVITEDSTAPGERHAKLADHLGEIAIRTWTGTPEDPEHASGGVDWIRAVEWVPYQRPTFVTPAFPGYVSGHSTFSRAAAEVLTSLTGSEYFPGGVGTWTIPAGALEFEAGPTTDIPLQWATYYDAADQAGVSRIYGGIHPPVDDVKGRVLGSQCGKDAWQMANRYWDGSARA